MNSVQSLLSERSKIHGDFSEVSYVSQEIKDAIRKGVNPHFRRNDIENESLDMIASKIARIACGNPHEIDHWLDIAGYATLVANSLEKPVDVEKEQGDK